MIRPAVQDDGGDVELVSVEQDGLVRIRLHGACVGCPSAHLTLHHGIERALRAELGDHIRVEAVALPESGRGKSGPRRDFGTSCLSESLRLVLPIARFVGYASQVSHAADRSLDLGRRSPPCLSSLVVKVKKS